MKIYGISETLVRSFRPMMRYPDTAQAPTKARKFPHIARPCKTRVRSGHCNPAFHVQTSARPTILPPTNASTNPTMAIWLKCSLSRNGDNNATHTGPVETNTTELATVVNSRDEIQVPK